MTHRFATPQTSMAMRRRGLGAALMIVAATVLTGPAADAAPKQPHRATNVEATAPPTAST
jgi:hypothetical protein